MPSTLLIVGANRSWPVGVVVLLRACSQTSKAIGSLPAADVVFQPVPPKCRAGEYCD